MIEESIPIMSGILYDTVTAILYPLIRYCMQPTFQYFLHLAFSPLKKCSGNELATCYTIVMDLKLHFTWSGGIDWYLLKFKKMV